MDTGYPAFIPEPLLNQKSLKPSTVPPPTNPDNPPGTDTQINLIGAPPIIQKVP